MARSLVRVPTRIRQTTRERKRLKRALRNPAFNAKLAAAFADAATRSAIAAQEFRELSSELERFGVLLPGATLAILKGFPHA